MHRFLRLCVPLLCIACRATGPDAPEGKRRGDRGRRYWPANLEQSSFERAGPLPVGHRLAGTELEQRCTEGIELAIAARASPEATIEALIELFEQCGDGFGIAWRIEHLHLQRKDVDGVAAWALRELDGTHPFVLEALQDLGRVHDQLDEAQLDAFAGLGATPEDPLWLPNVRLQMGYVATFVCRGDARKKSQALLESGGVMMDGIQFECIGGEDGVRYFALPNLTELYGR